MSISEVFGNPLKLSNRISSELSKDILKLKSKSRFRNIKNNKGGNKRGWYKLKIQKKTRKERALGSIQKGYASEINPDSTNYMGKAGEHVVMSELLFRAFNVSLMTVDEGIDIVCSKNNQFYHIQVKTVNCRKKGNKNYFSTNIRAKQFEQYLSSHKPFYIVVLRHSDKIRTLCDYVILPSLTIEQMVGENKISKGKQMISLTFEIGLGNKLFLNNHDITFYFNKWGLIR